MVTLSNCGHGAPPMHDRYQCRSQSISSFRPPGTKLERNPAMYGIPSVGYQWVSLVNDIVENLRPRLFWFCHYLRFRGNYNVGAILTRTWPPVVKCCKVFFFQCKKAAFDCQWVEWKYNCGISPDLAKCIQMLKRLCLKSIYVIPSPFRTHPHWKNSCQNFESVKQSKHCLTRHAWSYCTGGQLSVVIWWSADKIVRVFLFVCFVFSNFVLWHSKNTVVNFHTFLFTSITLPAFRQQERLNYYFQCEKKTLFSWFE